MSGQGATPVDPESLSEALAGAGVAGVTIAWADNNGIPRSRTVPVDRLADVARRGVGITTLFAVFDSHDRITFAHGELSTPSGDVRLLPVLDRLRPLAGQPALAWVPGRQLAADGSLWPYDQRGVLEAQLKRADELGLEVQAGYELEFFVGQEGDELQPAHHGPAYSPYALLAVDEFVARLLHDLDGTGSGLDSSTPSTGSRRWSSAFRSPTPWPRRTINSSRDRRFTRRRALTASASASRRS